MPIIERDIAFVGKDENGNTTIDKPVTRWGLVEKDASAKVLPALADSFPIFDSAASDEAKLVSLSALKSAVGGYKTDFIYESTGADDTTKLQAFIEAIPSDIANPWVKVSRGPKEFVGGTVDLALSKSVNIDFSGATLNSISITGSRSYCTFLNATFGTITCSTDVSGLSLQNVIASSCSLSPSYLNVFGCILANLMCGGSQEVLIIGGEISFPTFRGVGVARLCGANIQGGFICQGFNSKLNLSSCVAEAGVSKMFDVRTTGAAHINMSGCRIHADNLVYESGGSYTNLNCSGCRISFTDSDPKMIHNDCLTSEYCFSACTVEYTGGATSGRYLINSTLADVVFKVSGCAIKNTDGAIIRGVTWTQDNLNSTGTGVYLAPASLTLAQLTALNVPDGTIIFQEEA